VSLSDRDSLIMTNIRALAITGFLMTLGSMAVATSPQEVPAEVKSCKTIADDKERLRCFDSLFGSTPKPQNSPEGMQANWSIDESKSPNDGSPQVRIDEWQGCVLPRRHRLHSVIAGQWKLLIKTTRSTDGKVKEAKFN